MSISSFTVSRSRLLKGLRGEIELPADKSILHRAFMLSALAAGESHIRAKSPGRDNLATLRILTQLGVQVEAELDGQTMRLAVEEKIASIRDSGSAECLFRIFGKGFNGLSESQEELDCGNSGTSGRLLSGILASFPFRSKLVGDQSLSRRPFRRVTEPLSQMGAKFSGDFLPLEIDGTSLKAIEYRSPKASAQVKSAVLLAGLRATGCASVIEPSQSRDHTERMLNSLGCPINSQQQVDGTWRVAIGDDWKRDDLTAFSLKVPGDFSSASFFLVAASIFPDSDIVLKGIGLNPSRLGLLHLLERMGAKLEVSQQEEQAGEPVGDVRVQASQLRGIEVSPADVLLAIDEIPILAVAAAVAQGRTTISGAEELRVKESDRLAMVASLLSERGVSVKERKDGLEIEGQTDLFLSGKSSSEQSSSWRDCHDHRILMSAAILGLFVDAKFGLTGAEVVETSFSTFESCFQALLGDL